MDPKRMSPRNKRAVKPFLIPVLSSVKLLAMESEYSYSPSDIDRDLEKESNLYNSYISFYLPEEEISISEWVFTLAMESNLESKSKANHHDKQGDSVCENILDDGVEHDPKVTRSEGKSSKQDDQFQPAIADSC